MTRIILLLTITLLAQISFAQNTKTDDVEYRYIKLPLTPLPTSITHYQSSIFASYETKNAEKKALYDSEVKAAEAEYQQELKDYPAKVKAAEDKYKEEMIEWEKKPFVEKVVEKQVMKENNKPVKQIPSAPYRRTVPLPNLKTSYDYPALSSTYIVLDGFENNSENAVRIEVTLNGFDYTPPTQPVTTKNVVSVVNGTSTTRQVNYYHTEFTYRHTMSVKAIGPDGKEIFYITPSELNTYKVYKSAESATQYPINEEQLVKTHEEKILQENLMLINNLVNDRIGYKRENRKTELGYVKAKDETYKDLMVAFNDGVSGLKTLVDDKESATTKLQNSVQAWNTALQESDVNNKKARIDKDVTILIYFNLLEAYFALRDVSSAEKTITALNGLSISNSERKKKEAYETLFNDLKKRIAANK